jgi:Thiamine pyrophosphate enzyme, central domain
VHQARPVYLTLPTDRVFIKIPRGKLDTPLRPIPLQNDPATEEFALNEIQQLVEKAGSEVVILVDACAIRHDVTDEVWDLIQRTGFPVYSAPMGKTAVPEDCERFGGVRYLLSLPILGANVIRVDLCRLNFTSGNKGEGRNGKTCSLYWQPEIRLQHRQLHIPHFTRNHYRGKGTIPHHT